MLTVIKWSRYNSRPLLWIIDLIDLVCSDLDPAVVVPKDSEVMLKGESLTATCNALSSLETSTVWFKVRLKCDSRTLQQSRHFHILFRASSHPIRSLHTFVCVGWDWGRERTHNAAAGRHVRHSWTVWLWGDCTDSPWPADQRFCPYHRTGWGRAHQVLQTAETQWKSFNIEMNLLLDLFLQARLRWRMRRGRLSWRRK